MTLKAYIDESGTDERSQVFVFAGYVGGVEQFEELSETWARLLLVSPRVRYVKFAEAMGLKGEFFRMSEVERDRKLSSLTKLARQHSAFSISVVVPKLDFERASVAISRPKKHWNPWVLSFSGVMKVIHEYQRLRGMNEKVEFVFDDNDKYSKKIQDTWSTFKDHCDANFQVMLGNPPQFRNDLLVAPLQAADLLAGSIRHLWHAKLTDETPIKLPWEDPRIENPSLDDSSVYLHMEMVITKKGWIDYFKKQLSHLIFDDERTAIHFSEIFYELHVEILEHRECNSEVSVYLDMCGLQTEYVSRPL